MSLTESELIAEICRRVHHHPSPVGPGDDGAVIGELVIATDTMVQGTHFLGVILRIGWVEVVVDQPV